MHENHRNYNCVASTDADDSFRPRGEIGLQVLKVEERYTYQATVAGLGN